MERQALDGMTRKALVDLARRRGLSGYSAMAKADLVKALLAQEKPTKTAVPAAMEKKVPVAKEPVEVSGKKESGRKVEEPGSAGILPAPGGSLQDPPGRKPADAPVASAKKAAKAGKVTEAARNEVTSKAAEPARASRPAKAEPRSKPAKAEPRSKPAEAEPRSKPAEAEPRSKPAKAEPRFKPAEAEPRFKPAEAFLEGPDDAGDARAVPAAVTPEPQFKKTSKVDELLDVDAALGELPPTYDENRAVLLVRDPLWAYAYWDLKKSLTAPEKGDFRQILRVQELSGAAGRPAYFYDVPVPRHARSWYLKLPGDGRVYRIEVGLHYRDGSYAPVALSNAIEMPRAKPSEVVADRFITLPLEEPPAPPEPQQQSHLPPVAEWMVAPESIGIRASVAPPPVPAVGQPAPSTKPLEGPALYPEPEWDIALPGAPWSGSVPLAPGLRPGAPELRPGAPGLSGPVSSHAVSSWGFAPASEELQRRPAQKDFWLVADAELIVYGATEPDAKVTLRGETVQLRPDGTFSFRFYLPDGLHPIPIRALNADEDDERMITITVSRDTTGDGKTNIRSPHRPTEADPGKR